MRELKEGWRCSRGGTARCRPRLVPSSRFNPLLSKRLDKGTQLQRNLLDRRARSNANESGDRAGHERAGTKAPADEGEIGRVGEKIGGIGERAAGMRLGGDDEP